MNIVNVAGISSAIVLVEPGVAGTKTGLDAVVDTDAGIVRT